MLFDKLKILIAESVGDIPITPQSRFLEDLGMDDGDVMELITYLEIFGAEFPDEDFSGTCVEDTVPNFKTVQDMLDSLTKQGVTLEDVE